MSLTEFGLSKSRFAYLLMVGLVMAGFILYPNFSKREDPEITIRNAQVDVKFPGLPPQKMEKLIAEQLERKVREIKEVKEINTVIKTGSLRTSVTLKDEYSDLDGIWQDLRDKMNDLKRDLPSGAQGPFVNTDVGDVAIATIALTAEGFSYNEMEETAKDLQRTLYTVKGVAKVEVSGVQEERIWLELDARRFATIGAQVNTLIDNLQKQNIILPAGELNADGASFQLEASGDFQSVEEIENMLIKINDAGDFVRLKDLVTVKRGYVSPKQKPIFYNLRPAVVVTVQMQPSFDIQQVGDGVKTATEAFEDGLPIGYKLDFATFQPAEVTKSVNNALSNVGQTFVVVLVVVLLFLGVRSGIVIASIVPFAIMFSLIGMSVLGIALEQVSIAAVIISLGLLVDNGVVVVEDILRRIKEGQSNHEAAVGAGKQFAVPLLVSSLTTMFAFTPFFLLVGNEGEYAFSLGTVVVLTLTGSWLSAMYFMPLIAAKVLKLSKKDMIPEEERKPSKLAEIYMPLLRPFTKRAGVVVLVCYALVFGSMQLFGYAKNEMFPASERGEVLIYMDMPKGVHIEATEAVAKATMRYIADKDINPEVVDHIAYVGDGGPRFYLALSPEDPDQAFAFFLVNTSSNEGANEFGERFKRYAFENIPDAVFRVKRLSMGAGESGTVEIELSGPDASRLLDMGNEVKEIFAQAPGVIENKHDWGQRVMKFLIDVDQDNARRLDITSEQMAQVLSAYFDGYQISDFRQASETIPIMLRASERDRNSVEDLLNIVLPGPDGLMSLEQVATLNTQLVMSQIRRKDQVRTITVRAKSNQLTAQELYNTIEADLNKVDLSGGYKITIGGELKDSSEIYGKLGAGLPFAFLLMILAVVFQFNSMRRSAIIFMSVPLALIGVPVGLLVTGEPLSFFATLGIISLAGIVINNSIVLVDQIDIEREETDLLSAIVAAGGKRLQPILLTSITTVVGLLPLYLTGGALWSPLAAVMMFGLAIASVLTLFFVPALYYMFYRREAVEA
ncbi:efflux RND transporter permease subunit [Kordiimonas sp. SCSIO 12603]|uniref:efflux RND transporter permease subunit n=1 Tax=Kordiimonas sp. SCSIO 12603 TaxID=2829596 RepID=UPI002105A988|nr:efflux RND transporter permease subunit [Kordiimonas sp. SCSIO 12603]UTW59753.1 efflux RND transporter permease subunit [Kordiimonas sp. SCSIO 12603]